MDQVEKDFANRLNAIIESAIDGIITIDNKGNVETLNKSAALIFGYKPEDVIGQNIKILMPQPYHSEHDHYIHRYNTTRQAHIIGIGREVSGLKKNGTKFPFRLAVSEVILNDRVIYTGIIHDLTEVKKAQQEIIDLNKSLEENVTKRTYELEKVVNQLLNTNKNLEHEVEERQNAEKRLLENEEELQHALVKEKELNELKSRFVSMASHEFRTPLTSILSSAALIGKYDTAEGQENRVKHIERIKSAVSNLTGILNDFLSLSKLEEGKVELRLSTFEMHILCADVIEDTKALIKDDRQIIHRVHGIPQAFNTDENILRNILFNLISNAVKYSIKDVYCDVFYTENGIEILVKDHGIGIPLDDQKYLFSRFFRASNVVNIQGTGLGLNIVKRYIDLLDGEISFESKADEGTTFKVIIPYKKSKHEE